MNAENNIRVELVRMEGNIAPFVQVNYMDKDAQEHTGLFLLDSCSNENILTTEVVNSLGSLCTIVDGVKTIASMAQEVVKASQVSFPLVLGDNQFQETFCISNMSFSLEEITVIGILGNPFLRRNRLVIDFHDNMLHTSEISPSNFNISDCAFFFPMGMGLKFYRVPVLPIKQNGKELVTLVDTGANINVISNQALIDNDFKYERMKDDDVIMGLSGQAAADEAKVWFNMLLLYDDDITELSCCEYFKVLPDSIYTPQEGMCDTNGEQLPPIEVVLGFPFMAREGWILDFGAKLIYRRKN